MIPHISHGFVADRASGSSIGKKEINISDSSVARLLHMFQATSFASVSGSRDGA